LAHKALLRTGPEGLQAFHRRVHVGTTALQEGIDVGVARVGRACGLDGLTVEGETTQRKDANHQVGLEWTSTYAADDPELIDKELTAFLARAGGALTRYAEKNRSS
jgi:hypothetical protein